MHEALAYGFKCLIDEKFIAAASVCNEEFLLTGPDSQVDSVALVFFVSAIEDFMFDRGEQDFFVDLLKIPNFDTSNPVVTLRQFSDAIFPGA